MLASILSRMLPVYHSQSPSLSLLSSLYHSDIHTYFSESLRINYRPVTPLPLSISLCISKNKDAVSNITIKYQNQEINVDSVPTIYNVPTLFKFQILPVFTNAPSRKQKLFPSPGSYVEFSYYVC